MVTQSDFDYARAHPKTRKEFVRAVEREYASPYIAMMRYSEKDQKKKAANSEEGKITLMQCQTGLMGTVVQKWFVAYRPRSIVTVFPNVFDVVQSLETFMLCIDHEDRHAEDFYKGTADIGCDDVFNTVNETDRLYMKMMVDGKPITIIAALHKWHADWLDFNAYSRMIANPKGRNVPPEYMESCRERLAHYSKRLEHHRAMFSGNPPFGESR